jgi:hypothetical protein
VDRDEDKPMITREQALACLAQLGLDGDAAAADREALSRAEAVGQLLFLVEAALVGVDRLDQEGLHRGYYTAAALMATDGLHASDDAAELVIFGVATRMLHERVRRTRLDLADLAAVQDTDAWTASRAIDALLDAVLALTGLPTPILVHEGCDEHELKNAGDAVRKALDHLPRATGLLVEGLGAIEDAAARM